MSTFRWRDMQGNLHDPSEMDTDYVFNVYRMIWNHRTPPQCHMWFPDDVKYHFPKRYTKNYMKQAFKEMYWQLNYRRSCNDKNLTTIQSGYLSMTKKWMNKIPNMLLNMDAVIWS